MADMNDIFGSDSENESDNNKEHVDKSSEQDENQSENQDDQEEQEDETSVNKNDQEEEQEEGEQEEELEDNKSNDDQNEQEEDDDDNDDEIIKKKKAPKTSDVFGDELADLSPDEDGSDLEHPHEDLAERDRDVEEEEEPEQVINIEMPKVKADLGKEVHFVKLPNFLSVDPKPFSQDTYDEENLQGETLDEEGKTRVRLKIENTIRWRYEKDEHDNSIKQSNAKLVKWSDGSLSMYLGNEIFDVYKSATQGDHNHLFIRQGNVLVGQTVFRTRLSFRPHSIDSMTHRKMTLSLVEHGTKTKKVKILTEMAKNPENKRQELMKKEEEKLKAASRRQNQQRRMREKSHSKGLSADYLEGRYHSDDEEEGAISLSAIKNKFKPGTSKSQNYTSSDEESDRERRLNRAKSSNNNYEDDDDLADDSDEEGSGKKNKNKKKKKVVMDDDDE